MYKSISIKFGEKTKVFSIHLKNFNDALTIVEAYASSTSELNHYEFDNSKSYNLVDLYLSNFSTPQPRYSFA